MLTPLTTRQQSLISNNIRKVLTTNNIQFLSQFAYHYLYLCSGFIAHYDWFGFVDYYQNVNELKEDLTRNYDANMWSNFHPGEVNYDYYMAKANVYKAICAGFIR